VSENRVCVLSASELIAGQNDSVWETGYFKVVVILSQAGSFIATYLP
jgi:hypothetical protein